jgi:eukaryotic-like serine/threonine-protein kinase
MALSSPVAIDQLLFPGAVFEKYAVERELGRGGMGVVFSAMHTDLGRKVALKVLLPQHAGSERIVERFLREGRAAAKLSSEHVAKVLDVGRHPAGLPYLVMEYLDGRDLGRVVDEGGPLQLSEAIHLLLQVCEGLADAHAAGLVHRDLKPENLFLVQRKDGTPCVKVLDFGIAKEVAEASSMTGTNDTFGSPHYMSPEQLRASRTVDVRSDIWALGIVAFELLSARFPFDAESVFALASCILSDPPHSLGTLRPDLPKGFVDVVARCLEKKAADRPQNVAELAASLAAFGSDDDRRSAARVRGVLGVPERPVSVDDSQPRAIVFGGRAHDPTLQLPSLARSWTNPSATASPPAGRRSSIALGAGLLTVAALVASVTIFRSNRTPGANATSAGGETGTPTTLPSESHGLSSVPSLQVAAPLAEVADAATSLSIPIPTVKASAATAPRVVAGKPKLAGSSAVPVAAAKAIASASARPGHVGRFGDDTN